ncbi:MAG: hypothetical protein KBE23_11595 [Chloroflexi bacterium]|nr:hypothetical protein [Chloroflexota bacterium]MBP7043378.1 hypothetical protein [Chloroflexota bacterium]
MKIVERMIQTIYPGKNAALEAIDKRYDAVESMLGFPPKQRFWAISGSHNLNTLVIEREWESMAAMEAAYEKSFVNKEIEALGQEAQTIIKNSRMELYTPA